MGTGSITQYIDVAQITLYLFWIFFAGLIYYLVRENHREGYPMETDHGRAEIVGWPVPRPKIYHMADGSEVAVPSMERNMPQTLQAEPTHRYAGSPIEPTGNPLLAGVGPGAWCQRADRPDMYANGGPRLVPLRIKTEYGVSPKDTDPRGLPVIAGDGQVAGTITDLWIDRSEHIFRYLEVQVTGAGRSVLLPINFARVKRDRVKVRSIFAAHFAQVPGTASPDQVTLLEEDKIMAYYGAGTLYADPSRAESLI